MMINEIPTSQRVVAITFDDGPNPVYTPQVLEIFSEAKGKATFFMIGEQMRNHPDVVKQVCDQGHEIGNHTFTHPKLSELSLEDCLKEIEETEKLIEEMAGRKPVVFRPPYLSGYGLFTPGDGLSHDWCIKFRGTRLGTARCGAYPGEIKSCGEKW